MAKPLSRVFWKVLKSTGTHHILDGGCWDSVHRCVYPKNNLIHHFESRAEAETFAIKMATKNPGSRYYVLECVAGMVYNPGKMETVIHR